MSKLLFLCYFFFIPFVLLSPSSGQDRPWTNREGKSLQGSFVGQDEAKVKLRMANGKETIIPKASLGEADQEYLASLPLNGLEVNGLQQSRALVFDTVKIDVQKFELKKGHIGVGSPEFNQVLNTPHYRVVFSEKTPLATVKQVAESGERLWEHLTAGWPQFRKVYEKNQKRMLLFLPENEAESTNLYAWMATSSAIAVPYAWSTRMTECAMLNVPSPEALQVCNSYRYFSLYDNVAHGNSLKWPARIHYLAITWIYDYLYVAPYVIGDDSICSMVAGMAYGVEQEICGKVETFLKPPGSLKIGVWAAPVKRLVANGELSPNLELILKKTTNDITTPECALAWSLVRFLQADQQRKGRFQNYLHTLHLDGGLKPNARELAKATGYNSPADFSKAWLEFINTKLR